LLVLGCEFFSSQDQSGLLWTVLDLRKVSIHKKNLGKDIPIPAESILQAKFLSFEKSINLISHLEHFQLRWV
jgi:hypothetical protein